MALRNIALVSETEHVPPESLDVVAAAFHTQVLRDLGVGGT
jgi:hypothetical protein